MSTIKKSPNHPKPADLLQYLPLYKVAVCSSCRYAIQPQAISRHLKEIHHINRGHRRPFMHYISTLSLSSAESILHTKIHEFPVPLLPVQDGFMCEREECGHLCVSVKRMRTHWLEQHGRSGQAILDWRPVKLQTFFRGTLLKYFTDPVLFSGDRVAHCGLKNDPEYQRSNDVVQEINSILSIVKPGSYPELNSADASLFNHYIASTARSISTEGTTELWQVYVPQLSHQHPFLLHGIIAISALHLSHLSPSKDRIITANTHQSLALPLFRAAINAITQQNSEAVLIFSHLLVLYSFASESSNTHLLLTTPSSFPLSDLEEEDEASLLPPWLYFLRNGCSLLCTVWDYLETSPVAALASSWDIPILQPSAPTPLLTHLLSVPFSAPDNKPWIEAELALYTRAATELASAFFSLSSPSQPNNSEFTTWDALRVWPMELSIEFLSLLKQHHSGALILLAHYCILLKKIEGHWYFEGRAQSLLNNILRYLGTEWLGFVRLPLEEVGVDIREEVGGTGLRCSHGLRRGVWFPAFCENVRM